MQFIDYINAIYTYINSIEIGNKFENFLNAGTQTGAYAYIY